MFGERRAMASPRARWFRVPDSIVREDWSNDQVATFVRLCGWLNTRWARDGISREEAGRAVVTPADLMKITGRRRSDYALRTFQELVVRFELAASKLGVSSELRASFVGGSWQLELRNFAEFQALPSGPRASPARTSDASASSPSSAVEELHLRWSSGGRGDPSKRRLPQGSSGVAEHLACVESARREVEAEDREERRRLVEAARAKRRGPLKVPPPRDLTPEEERRA